MLPFPRNAELMFQDMDLGHMRAMHVRWHSLWLGVRAPRSCAKGLKEELKRMFWRRLGAA